MKDFLTINQLKAFNTSIAPLTESIETDVVEDTSIDDLLNPIETKSDKIKFESWLKKPEDIDETILNGLADIQDGNVNGDNNDFEDSKSIGPNTIDMIIESLAVAYITKDGIPVGFAVISDPTVEDWKGVVPLSYYELKSGFNLDGRLQQLYFKVSPEYDGYGLSNELRNQISKVAPLMFSVVPSWDKLTLNALQKNGYEFKGEFETTWEKNPVQLWIN